MVMSTANSLTANSARFSSKNEAEHAHAADRFAREIVGFLAVIAVRSRRLMGNPFGGIYQRS
jgi:hypothetical protein